MSEIIACVERPRKGKTTVMTALLIDQYLNDEWMLDHFDPYWNVQTGKYEEYLYDPQDVYANYFIDIKGVNCLTNDEMIAYLKAEIKAQTQKKIILIDECGQLLPALNYHDKKQVAIVRSFQQYPKLYKFLVYASAPGKSNGVDPNLRMITKYVLDNFTYHHDKDRNKDYIDFRVNNDDEDWDEAVKFLGPARIQKKFDSRRPVR